MIRKIIKIDEQLCDGCGACAKACHEGAIDIVDGKAKLVREHFCDGLGDCLPNCHASAISFEEREAPEYDELAVLAAKKHAEHSDHNTHTDYQCPRSDTITLSPDISDLSDMTSDMASELKHWPCQIKLLPISAPYYQNASLLIAADCTAFAYAAIHHDFMRGCVTAIGCPKLDGVDYSTKLAEILRLNDISDITVLRMEVPCCAGIDRMVRQAVKISGKTLHVNTVTVSINGKIIH